MLERLAFCAVEKVQCWFQRRFVVHVGCLNGLGCKVQVEAFDPKYVSRHCVKKRSLWKFGSFGRVVVPGKELKEILEFLMTLLLCHGIELNSGPIDVVVSSCNVQSPNGVWSLLDYVARDSRLSVVAIQEVRMNERELETFRRAAKRRGYKLFCVVGRPTVDRWGHTRECGGVCYLVDSRLQARERLGGALSILPRRLLPTRRLCVSLSLQPLCYVSLRGLKRVRDAFGQAQRAGRGGPGAPSWQT